jgi:hypothetical protein
MSTEEFIPFEYRIVDTEDGLYDYQYRKKGEVAWRASSDGFYFFKWTAKNDAIRHHNRKLAAHKYIHHKPKEVKYLGTFS